MTLKLSFKLKLIIISILLTFSAVFLCQYITLQLVEKYMVVQALKNIKEDVLESFVKIVRIYSRYREVYGEKEAEIILLNLAQIIRKSDRITDFKIIDQKKRILVSKDISDLGKFLDDEFVNKINEIFKKQKKRLIISQTKNFIKILSSPQKTAGLKLMILIKFSKHHINNRIQNIKNSFLYIGISIIIISIVISILFSERVSNKLIKIKKSASIIGTGDFKHRLKLKSFLKDEFSDLADDINNMASGLSKAEKLKMENERFEQEMAIAEQIQKTLLPNSKPSIKNYEFGNIYYSAREVGGDYYDWIQIDEEHLGIVCADVSGKGVPGAFVMAITRSLLRSYAVQIKSPYQLLVKLNELLKKDIKKGMFVTMWYGILNIQTGHVRFVNAGHNPLIVFRKEINDIEIVDPKGSPIGILNPKIFNKKLIESEIQLNSDDMIIQYTDGVTEAFNENKEMYEEQRLYSKIKNNGNSTAEEMVDIINQDVTEFVNGFEQSDDILIVTIKRKG